MSADLHTSAITDLAAADDASRCKWRPSGEFALVHPTGWSIARYAVYGERKYLLWEPVNRCTAPNSHTVHGPFDDVREAMRLHRQLALQEAEYVSGQTRSE